MYLRYVQIKTGFSLQNLERKAVTNNLFQQRFVPNTVNAAMWVFQLSGQIGPFCNFAKFPTFEGSFSCFHGQNIYKIRVSAHCRVQIKKLSNIKVKKKSLSNVHTFLGHKIEFVREKNKHISCTWYKSLLFSILDAAINGPHKITLSEAEFALGKTKRIVVL